MKTTLSGLLLLLSTTSWTRALVLPQHSNVRTKSSAQKLFQRKIAESDTNCICVDKTNAVVVETIDQRRRRFGGVVFLGLFILAKDPSPSFADVSDGNVLPKGAQQFAKSIKLQKDVMAVRRRLTTAAPDEIDSKEWSNIEKFLRDIYSIADNDMSSVAVGIFNPENKAIALKDVDQIKLYAKAGDVSASKKDPKSLEQILAKISDLQGSFFASLSDIPDEL